MELDVLNHELITELFSVPSYQLEDKIGEGGFGYVYRAKQLNTGQTVAIKFIRLSHEFDALTKQRYIDRFEREALLCSRLEHPNIVRILDKGCCNDLLYAVFEYVDGLTLKQTLADSGPLLPATAAEIMAQVLDALAHAHGQGVIHRDIKPANIMLTKTGAKTHAKVLDFGIGTLVSEARQVDFKSITLTQETLGTPSYSAPEQLRGEPPTPRTDIYVWGLVFLESMIGEPVVSGSSLAAVFHKQLSESNIPLPAALAGHQSAAFLRRVLDKKAHQRAGNAKELYNEFTQLNFSTLVGDIAKPIAKPTVKSSEIATATDVTVLGNDETLIGNDSTQLIGDMANSMLSYTALTERKQISVLSVALTVKTQALDDSHIDFEVVDTIHRDQKAVVMDIAIRYGAFHVGTVGDTLLFYFGYPVVSDNDNRLCARAALEIASKLHNRNVLLKQSQGIEVFAHMGMHTGIVMIYADAVPEGHTINIAMRLARAAKGNQIVCTQVSYQRLGSFLEFQPLKDLSIGISEQGELLYSMTGERQAEAFGFLRVNKNKHAFVGRAQELATVQQVLGINQQGEPDTNDGARLAHIYGEAGIGKSRLIFELKNDAQGFNHYTAQCLPEYQNSALYPIFNVIKAKYALDAYEPHGAVKVLRHVIEQLDDLDVYDVIPVLCSWLALPLPADIAISIYTPDEQKAILFNALIALLVTKPQGINEQPGLLMFEDMHWADSISIAFVAKLSADSRFKASGDVFISTSRQPLPVALEDKGFAAVELNKFDPEQSAQLVSALLDNMDVKSNLLDVVVTRADGIPLFIEELVNMLKHKHIIHHVNGSYDFVNEQMKELLPDSLRESLQQKLDALVYAKETAQLAATIGREFDYELLAIASNHSEGQLQINLKELIENELLFVRRQVSGDSYVFKHALVRDAAYDSMPQQRKQHSHNQIGTILAQYFPTRAQENPQMIAQHFSAGKNYQRAAEFGVAYSKQLVVRSENIAAEESAATNLQWAEHIGAEHDKDELCLLSYEVLLPAQMTTKGYGAQEVIETKNNIVSLVEKLQAEERARWDDLIDKCNWVQFMYYHWRSERENARNLGNKILAEARAKGDKKATMIILTHTAQANHFDGDYPTALAHFNESISLFDEVNDPNVGLEYGIHVRAMSMIQRVFCYFYHLGDLKTSLKVLTEGLEYAEKIKHIGSVVFAYCYFIMYYFHLGDFEKAKQYCEMYYQKYCQTREVTLSNIVVDMYYAWAKHEVEDAEKLIDELTATGNTFTVTFHASFLARVFIKLGQYEKAVGFLQQQLNNAQRFNAKFSQPILKGLLAKSLYLDGGIYSEEVEQMFQSALEDARQQQTVYLELEILCDQHSYSNEHGAVATKCRIQQIMDDYPITSESPLYQQAMDIVSL